MSAASCGDCLFYESISQDYGFCRRDPPQITDHSSERYYGGRSGLNGIWPVICVIDWCGEYKDRPWVKGEVEMDDPPPEPDPPDGGIVVTPKELTDMNVTQSPFGDPIVEAWKRV